MSGSHRKKANRGWLAKHMSVDLVEVNGIEPMTSCMPCKPKITPKLLIINSYSALLAKIILSFNARVSAPLLIV